MVPDAIDLALRMRRLTQWVDSRRQPATLIRRQFRGGSLGNCYVTIDPDRQTPFASSNLNRVYMCGAEVGMSSSSVPRMIDLFLTERVNRFFCGGPAFRRRTKKKSTNGTPRAFSSEVDAGSREENASKQKPGARL
jgi:hypothetical protein